MLTLGSRAVEYLESRRNREKLSAAAWVAAVMFLLPLAMASVMLIWFFYLGE